MAVSNAMAATMAKLVLARLGVLAPLAALAPVATLALLAVLMLPAPAHAQSAQAPTIFEAFSPVARQDHSIRLRSSCRVTPGASVTLGDIAFLEGARAQALAGVVIVPAGDVANLTSLDISIARVRAALASYDSTLEGRVLVSGSSTRIWFANTAAHAVSASTSGPAHGDTNPTNSATVPHIPTVRDAVLEKIAGVLSMPIDVVRVQFEPQDDEFLSMRTPGRTVAASPTGTGERIGVVVRVYERDRIVASKSIRVGVLIRQTCAVVTATIERGEMLSTSSFRIEERDVPPGTAFADPATLLGRSARSRLAPGRIIQARDVESPVLVSRGDIVTIECLSGGILLKTSGRARGSGREGDIVSFEPLRRGRPFEARIAGPGRAVAISESDPNQEPNQDPSQDALAARGTPVASAFLPDASPDAPTPAPTPLPTSVLGERVITQGATGIVTVPLP